MSTDKSDLFNVLANLGPRHRRGSRRHRATHLRGRRACGNTADDRVPHGEFEPALGILAAFVRAGLVAPNGEARRQIKGGGLKVNDVTVVNEKMSLTSAHLTPEGVIKLRLARAPHAVEAGVRPGR